LRKNYGSGRRRGLAFMKRFFSHHSPILLPAFPECRWVKPVVTLAIAGILGWSLLGGRVGRSQPVPLQPDPTPLDLKAIRFGILPPTVISASTISQTGLTLPSLWWLRDQLADLEQFGNKLVDTWLAYPRQPGNVGRVDLVVNRQGWSLLDYLERYEMINRFSTDARGYGYNLRVFDDRGTFVGAATCDFSRINGGQLPDAVTLPLPPEGLPCRVFLDAGGRSSGLNGGSANPFDAGSPKSRGTVAP